jgi:LPXTG-motif cell wall-anchored protein
VRVLRGVGRLGSDVYLTFQAVPEPSSLILAGIGLAGIGLAGMLLARRRKEARL